MREETFEQITMKYESMPLPSSAQKSVIEADAIAPSGKSGSNESMTRPLPAVSSLASDNPTAKKQGKQGKKQQKQGHPASAKPNLTPEQLKAYMTQERCRHLCLSIFFREQTTVRSLGFTSSVRGEGKSFLASISARSLARDSGNPVTLLECNWEHPRVHEYFGIASSPGLAEYLRGEVNDRGIRYQVDSNLTVIPAGNGQRDAVTLFQRLRRSGSLNTFCQPNELLIIDLPPVLTTAYGALIASLVDALLIVVQAQVTPQALIAETCSQLNGLPVEGLLLNQVESHIPRWLQHLL